MSLDRLFGQRRHAGGNLSIDRDIRNPDLLHRRDQGAGFACMAIEEAFAFECGNVLHHRRLARKPKMLLNLARARRDAFFPLLALDEIENAFLTTCQHAL